MSSAVKKSPLALSTGRRVSVHAASAYRVSLRKTRSSWFPAPAPSLVIFSFLVPAVRRTSGNFFTARIGFLFFFLLFASLRGIPPAPMLYPKSVCSVSAKRSVCELSHLWFFLFLFLLFAPSRLCVP